MSEPVKLISREPWWATPPSIFESEDDVVWGYLEHYSDGTWRFTDERPTDEEIRGRKSCRIERSATI
mgnify:CR=1 FL=1|tara:strand:+ start:18775 stop:18975 length:201 start_codon:yes stop_codon:yes gene_type:complete